MSSEPIALVTGAARGIGAATATRLARNGWRVIAVDICSDDPTLSYSLARRSDLDALALSAGDRMMPVQADVRDLKAVRAVVADIVSRYGGLDAIVSCAGVIVGGVPAWDLEESAYEVVMDVNVRGLHNLIAAGIPAMLQRPTPRSGRFVAVASAAAHRGLFHLAAYGAAKAAVAAMVTGLATDLRGTGITAMAVSPGATRSTLLDATAQLYGLDQTDDLLADQLIDRVIEPAEVASVIGWLCDPQTAILTGSVIHADGGLTT